MNPNSKPEKPSQDSVEFLAEVSDSIIKVTTESEILEEVPVISWITKAFSIKEAFQLRRLRRNCEAFIKATRSGDPSKLQARLADISSKPVDSKEFTDTIQQILIEGEKPLKAELVGNVLVGLAESQISYEDFETLSLLILSAPVPALQAIPQFFVLTDGQSYSYKQSVGGSQEFWAVEALLNAAGVIFRQGNMVRMSRLGCCLYRLGFKGVLPL